MADAEVVPSQAGPSALVPGKEEGDDVLDRPNFDATAYLDALFPDEASLSGLDPLISALQRRIARVDAGILAAVRQQGRVGGAARSQLQSARRDVTELCSRVASIRGQATASEALVRGVCADVSRLDGAKRALTGTISSLRRLAMLMSALDALQAAVDAGEYAEAGALLEAVQALAAHFSAYAHVPRVAELRGRLGALEAAARARALREFDSLAETAPAPVALDRARAACVLVGALGYGARDEVIDAVCRREMGVYGAIFGSSVGDTARLERTVNRYKWLLKRLEARRDVWALFPADWHVPQLLCAMFCNITRTALAEILDLKSGELDGQVDALLKAVEATNIFEAELARRFGDDGAESGSGESGVEGAYSDEDDDDDGAPASRVRARYERSLRERRAAADAGAAPERVAAREHAAAAAVSRARFRGAISPVFTPHLGVYVAAVERDLARGLDASLSRETWQPMHEEGPPLLHSAEELVEAVRAEMRDCVRRVGRGQVLRDLASAFGRIYSRYAAALRTRGLRVGDGDGNAGTGGGGGGASNSGASGGLASLAHAASAAYLGSTVPGTGAAPQQHANGGGNSTTPVAKLTLRDAARIALVLSTAERCVEMVGQLASAVQARLEPGLANAGAPSLESEFEDRPAADLRALMGAAHVTLVSCAEAALEPELGAAARVDWAAATAVDESAAAAADQSPFVGTVAGLVRGWGGALARLPPNHFRFFADKLLATTGMCLGDTVFKVRAWTEPGTQQARLDVELLKHALTDMARAGGMRDTALTAYTQAVSGELGKVQAQLKVIGAPPPALVDTFFELLPSAPPAEFQRIVDVKGLRRTETQALLEEFNRRLGRRHFATITPGGEEPAEDRGPQGAPPAPRRTMTMSFAGLGSGGSSATPGKAAQEMAARFKASANVQAARASAAAASDSMRETVGRTLGAMKNLRFMQRDG